MKLVKYSKSGSGKSAGAGNAGSRSDASSSEISGGSASLDRIIWGQYDDGDDVDGSMTVNGNIYIKVIEEKNYEPDDDDDGEYVDEETGGGSLYVEEDVEVGKHLYINYSHPAHGTNKKCVGDILSGHETGIGNNTTEITSLKTRVSTNETDISNHTTEINSLKSRVSTNETNITTAFDNYLPVGAIIMFNGLASAIPDGWHICDGTNGTPNLIDKFIKSGNSSGETGGKNSVKLTQDNIPIHYHQFRNYLTQVNGNGEINDGPITILGDNLVVGHTDDYTKAPTRRAQTADSGYSDIPYIINFTDEFGKKNNDAFDIQPEYYTLIFIMKIA